MMVTSVAQEDPSYIILRPNHSYTETLFYFLIYVGKTLYLGFVYFFMLTGSCFNKLLLSLSHPLLPHLFPLSIQICNFHSTLSGSTFCDDLSSWGGFVSKLTTQSGHIYIYIS